MDEDCGHVLCNLGSFDVVVKAFQAGELPKELLVECNGDVYPQTPLHCASYQGNADVITFLCENLDHKHLTERDWSGLTPLHLACRNCDKPAKPLIDYLRYEDLIEKGSHGETPFYQACLSGNLGAVKELTKRLKPQDMETPCNKGIPPLRIAHATDRAEVLEWLMAHMDIEYVTTELKKKPGDYNDPFLSNLWEFIGNQRPFGASQLGDKYLLDPIGTRLACRKHFGLHYEDASSCFALIVGLCDGYFTLNLRSPHIPTTIRFFNSVCKLPMELQMLICNRTFDSEKDTVKKSDLDEAVLRMY